MDVEEQRGQLYRKLEALRNQGIELGPNLNVLRSEGPNVNHAVHTAGPPSHISAAMEKGFYHGDHSTTDGTATNQGSSILMDKTGIATSGTGLLGHSASSSSIGVRKASSMSGVSVGPIVNQASSVATGGSLKKDSFSTNLHLLSATNETKHSIIPGIEKHEIQQKTTFCHSLNWNMISHFKITCGLLPNLLFVVSKLDSLHILRYIYCNSITNWPNLLNK